MLWGTVKMFELDTYLIVFMITSSVNGVSFGGRATGALYVQASLHDPDVLNNFKVLSCKLGSIPIS